MLKWSTTLSYSKSRLSSVIPCKFLHSQLFSHAKHNYGDDGDENPPLSPQLFMPSSSSPDSGSYKLGDSTFYSLIHNYASSADFRSLEKVLDRIKSERRVLVEKCFIVIFRAYGKAHLPNKAVDLFQTMLHDFRCRPTVKSFNSVLNVIIQEHKFSSALDFYYSNVVALRSGVCKDNILNMKNMNISPNVLTFNLVIKAMCKLGLVDRAVQVFREIPLRNCTHDVFTYSTLMDGLCKENRIDEAVSLLDEMQIEGCFPTPVTFNVLISALCKKGDIGRAAKLVDNMFLKDCLPNEATYNALIHGLCLKGKLDKAVSLLDRMVMNKCVPNDVTYGTIINGLVKHGRAVDGANLLVSMEERGRHANEYVYSALISGLFKEGKYEEAMGLWKDMTGKGHKPNVVVYSALIDGLCREGKPDKAKGVMFEMVKNGFNPNSRTYSCLMRGFFKASESHKALLLWKEIVANNLENEFCYSILIDGLCGDGKVKEALMMWKQMLYRGFKPDVVAYSSMIHGLCNAGLVEQGMNLFNEMLCLEPESLPDVITYNILLNALCKNGSSISRAVDLLNHMLDRGCDPDVVTCDIFLRTMREKLEPPQDGREFLNELAVRLLKRERIKGASTIVEVMLQKFLPPKASTWARLIQQLCKPKKVQRAIESCQSSLYC